MSKNHDFGFVSSRRAADFFAFADLLCARVPRSAAAMEMDGDEDLSDGGANRLFSCGFSNLL